MKVLYLNFDRATPVLGEHDEAARIREFVHAAVDLGHEVVLACADRGGGNAPPPACIIEFAADDSQAIDDARGKPLAADLPDELAATLRRELASVAYDRDVDARVLKRLAALGFRPDLVYERHALFHRAGATIARYFGCPRVLEVDAPLVDERRCHRGLYLEQTARTMEASSLRCADRVITTSEALRDQVRASGIDAARIHVMHAGVEVRRFGLAEAGVRLRAELGLRRGDCLIGAVASIRSPQDATFLLDVFREIAAQRPSARLLTVGDGPGSAALRERAGRSDCADRITLVGPVPRAQVPAWIGTADVMIAPCGNVRDSAFPPFQAMEAVEALASGKPIVAPRLGRFLDVVDHGRTGLLYEPGDASGCRDAMLDLIDDPARRRAMGLEARLQAVDHDWERIVRRIIEPAAWSDATRARTGS